MKSLDRYILEKFQITKNTKIERLPVEININYRRTNFDKKEVKQIIDTCSSWRIPLVLMENKALYLGGKIDVEELILYFEDNIFSIRLAKLSSPLRYRYVIYDESGILEDAVEPNSLKSTLNTIKQIMDETVR